MNIIPLQKLLLLSAIALGFFIPVRQAPADIILFGSSGDTNANGGGLLYRIDVTTQTVTLIGNTGVDRLGGIAFDKNGVLYGAAGGALNSLPGTLITIDPNTAAAAPVGTFASNLGVEALRFNSQNTLYGGALDSNIANGVLLTIDPTNANILSSVATIGSGSNSLTPGLAFSSNDTLYGSRGNSFLHAEDVDLVDPNTGVLTPLPLSIPDPAHPISDLSFGSDGILYGSSAFGQLYSIDPGTGVETLLFDTHILKFSGLASQFVPSGPQNGSVPDTGDTALLFIFALGSVIFFRYRVSSSSAADHAV